MYDYSKLTQDEKQKALLEMMESFLLNADEDGTAKMMMNIMPNMMGSGMPMMKRMCQQMMGTKEFGQGRRHSSGEDNTSDGGDKKGTIFATPEIKGLFEDWVIQVQEEIIRFRSENECAGIKEIADYLKISEESLEFFMKDMKTESFGSGCGAGCESGVENPGDADYETVKIEKIKNVCPMCEDFAKEQTAKPIVIMSCEGACLRGEVSRRAANLICHSLSPEKTVRLCLGGAFTKEGGQRNLVRNAEKVVALEGCFIKCASRMMKGVVKDVEPEVIVTDQLFDFDTVLFGINEMSEADIQTNSLDVARKIIAKL